jgi:DMSO/TMAO reductase YedYZ molybdopterin-dependent catalytic subunit
MKSILKRTKILIPIITGILLAALIASCQTGSNGLTSTAPDTTEPPATVSPETEDTRVALTPIEELGITGTAQDVDINNYRLTIDGLVEEPLSLNYQAILDYPSITEIVTLNCPGYFVDVAEWTGVPLTTILAEAGIKPEASQITFYAIDGYHRTLSLEHVNTNGAFLAYEVNGQTLPPEHGYPLRLVDKGSYGDSWIKWLERIEVK